VVQFPLGWLMPEIKRGMQPGTPMNVHMSIGLVMLALIVVRFAWRVTHRVPPHQGLPVWQSVGAEALHWLLYALVFVATLTGWFYASMRGWTITLFWLVPIPPLVEQGSQFGRALGRLHQNLVWVLIAFVLLHLAAALVHMLVYKDRVMQRMLP
jgi:cytochrome b561